jgi:hypothetical protein
MKKFTESMKVGTEVIFAGSTYAVKEVHESRNWIKLDGLEGSFQVDDVVVARNRDNDIKRAFESVSRQNRKIEPGTKDVQDEYRVLLKEFEDFVMTAIKEEINLDFEESKDPEFHFLSMALDTWWDNR